VALSHLLKLFNLIYQIANGSFGKAAGNVVVTVGAAGACSAVAAAIRLFSVLAWLEKPNSVDEAEAPAAAS
jgi:hypothetical protein